MDTEKPECGFTWKSNNWKVDHRCHGTEGHLNSSVHVCACGVFIDTSELPLPIEPVTVPKIAHDPPHDGHVFACDPCADARNIMKPEKPSATFTERIIWDNSLHADQQARTFITLLTGEILVLREQIKLMRAALCEYDAWFNRLSDRESSEPKPTKPISTDYL